MYLQPPAMQQQAMFRLFTLSSPISLLLFLLLLLCDYEKQLCCNIVTDLLWSISINFTKLNAIVVIVAALSLLFILLAILFRIEFFKMLLLVAPPNRRGSTYKQSNNNENSQIELD